MAKENPLKKVQSEIEKGLEVCHCKKCGCMIEALNNIRQSLDSRNYHEFSPDFRAKLESYLKELESAESS